MIEGEGSGFPPEARRDGREAFGKKRGIEGEGSELKEAGGLGGPEARRDGREGFGKEEGD